MTARRDPTQEERILWCMGEHGEDSLYKLAPICGYTPMQMRRVLNILVREGKVSVRQRNGVKVYGRTDI